MATLKELYEKGGQSPWLDNIKRSWLKDGTLKRLIAEGVRGLTSNPTIFAKAIEGSTDYDEQFLELIRSGLSVEESYWELVKADIREAARELMPVYEASSGSDGYVSIEVDPRLARNTKSSIEQAKKLHENLSVPNLLVKIPATKEGVAAIEELTYLGVSINATLIFSRSRYREVARAYKQGLKRRLREGLEVSSLFSVASFFVSRVDTILDPMLADSSDEKLSAMQGKVAVYNARLAYQAFKEEFGEESFGELRASGARIQKPLWASTSTKNPAYSDLLYVESLIGPNTVNTMPDSTLEAFIDHGRVGLTLETELDEARDAFERLSAAGIDFEAVAQELEDKGVQSFTDSYNEVLEVLERKSASLERSA